MMKRLIFALCVLFTAPAWAANSFTDAVSWWNFENDLTDSGAGGNDLTAYGTVLYNNTLYKVGSYSLKPQMSDGVDCAYRADTNLSAGFPGKSGQTNTTMSICFWVRFNSFPGSGNYLVLAGKYYWGSGYQSWLCCVWNSSGNYLWRVLKSNSGGTANVVDKTSETHPTLDPATNLATGVWYHVGITVDATGNWRIRAYDATADAVEEASGQFTDEIGIPAVNFPFAIGARGASTDPTFDLGSQAQIDELAIWGRELTATEIDAVRGGTYATASSGKPAIHRLNRARRSS